MDRYTYSEYKIPRFSVSCRRGLKDISDILLPHKNEILKRWIALNNTNYSSPLLKSGSAYLFFERILDCILAHLASGELELCLDDMEELGSELASADFPFDLLVYNLHYMEEAYMPIMLSSIDKDDLLHRIVVLDEFLHCVIAAISTAYFKAYQKELMERAEIGRIVQEALLATIPKRTDDLEVFHVYLSARQKAQIGGDFLDFFKLGNNGSAFIIGDLSGHGLEAAADSILLRSLFKGFLIEDHNLSIAMERLNRVVDYELKPGQFATALAATYQTSGQLNLVSAGHPYPVLFDSLENTCSLVEVHGPALAILPDAKYKTHSIKLAPGSVFVAYTDGLTESRTGNDIFGEEGVVDTIKNMCGYSARLIAEALVEEAVKYSKGPVRDDLAIIVIKRHSVPIKKEIKDIIASEYPVFSK
ncbi:MAG: PP2C family protein-serine/threonine phosphatase [Armatimonadota bacterium]